MKMKQKGSNRTNRALPSALLVLGMGLAAESALHAQATLSPRSMKVVGEVDPRFVSYNVEAVEVTGGRFWAPFDKMPPPAPEPPPGVRPDRVSQENDPRFRYRPPIDLSNVKLRNLAAALGPAFIRVSGTWRNSTYFQNDDNPQLKVAPTGFQNVMTRAQWKAVIDFAHAVQGDIVASVTTSEGVRDKDGLWQPAQAKAWFDYTKSVGGTFAAMEFMNEPTLVSLSGASDKYGAAEYGKDSKSFEKFLRKESPGTLYLGPSSAAEGLPQPPGGRLKLLPSESLLQATGPMFDGFSYHVYYTRSHRCMGVNGTDPSTVLEPKWFERGDQVEQFYAGLRDRYLPGKPLWLTETGEASCGGDTWASSFVDSFRLLDQFGDLAQHSVKSVMYNTLASSDYGMLDENTLNPRPNYWASLLWNRTMGTRALEPGVAVPGLRVYSQCMKNHPGGVSMLVMNIAKDAHELKVPLASGRLTLSAPSLLGQEVLLNGVVLKASADGKVPEFKSQKVAAGLVSFAPETITVLTMPAAGNQACSK